MEHIETHATLEGFFEELLREAMAVEHVDLEHASFVYVTNLFAEFAKPDSLHKQQQRDDRGTPALVSLYEQASTAEPGRRFDAYRYLGDVSLVVGGLFTPHIQRERSLVGVDYYVQMGSAAYDAASALATKSGFGRMLGELSQKFERLLEVLSRVAERTTLPVTRDLRALYERMLQNPKSLLTQERLLAEGVGVVFAPAKA